MSASASGATTTTQLPVRTTGALQYGSDSANIPAANNSGFVHIAAANAGAVAIKANGEIWRSRANAREWIKIGDGASTGPGQSGFLNYGGTFPLRDGVWIKNGALQFASGTANIPDADNNGFVTVATSGGGGVAIKSNGEAWQSRQDTPNWIKIGDGASTGPGQSGFLNYTTVNPAKEALWIKDGVLRFGTGTASVPAVDNNGFVSVAAANGGAVAIKANGEVWRTRADAPYWVKVGDGASTGPGQSGFLNIGAQGGADGVWIKNGVLQYGDEVAFMLTSQNNGFVRVAASGGGAVAIKSNGEIWRTRANARQWTKIGDGASIEAIQSGFINYGESTGGDSGEGTWIKTSLSCPLPS
ncbi:hypothetical protein FHR86_003845 [Paenarthrobacter ilicis]|uniref:Uncharacterized protein n=1 Tax=Paenarthrobacter ilicis TaxID=43665 RepID=A0ABX0TLK9_9MICC|nr:hypothetical protein [Paenarthrobacter ilicis]